MDAKIDYSMNAHGVIFTPEPICRFMVESVEDILKEHFNLTLKDVNILEPFLGTGNIYLEILKKADPEKLYANEFWKRFTTKPSKE